VEREGHASLHLADGGIDVGDGVVAMTTLVMFRDLKLVTRGAQALEGVLHVRLVSLRVFNQHAAGDDGSEHEGEHKGRKLGFHVISEASQYEISNTV